MAALTRASVAPPLPHNGPLGAAVETSGSGTTTDAYSYDPYGAPRYANNSIPNPHRYISGHLDTTTHLTKFGYRYYDPTLARITQVDFMSQEADILACGRSDPINESDPTGVDVSGRVRSAVELIVGGLATFGGLAGEIPSGGLSSALIGAGLASFALGYSDYVNACGR